MHMTEERTSLDLLGRLLLRNRNSDGGWGYSPGKTSRLEPTCWALLALRDSDAGVLRSWPAQNGLLLERSGGEANYGFHAVALLTMLARGVDHATGVIGLLQALQRVRGVALPESTINRQDNKLQGWSWFPETFSWVEPTAWGLLALKKWMKVRAVTVDPARLAGAHALLVDRCCADGGWNYGNSNMLGQDLRPYVPTTAVALLALLDRRSESVVKRSTDYLDRAATTEPSGVALSLALIALRALGRSIDATRAALLEQIPTTLALKNHLAVALTLCALTDQADAIVL
jgi:hypothetical protein